MHEPVFFWKMVHPLSNRHAFTLLEIIVVIGLVSTILFFAVPRMDGSLVTNESRKVSNWIVLNVADLKAQSVRMQTEMTLHVDMDHNRFWIADASPGDSGGESGEATGGRDDFTLPPGYRVTALMLSNDTWQTSGTGSIRFYPKGYSDRAVIHLTDQRKRKKSFVVESFLPRVRIHDDHVGF